MGTATRARRPLPNVTHRDLMLATTGKLFSKAGWILELKYDGFRCLVSKCRGAVRLESRRGRDMSSCFPELVDEIAPIPHDFAADGELVVLDHRGRPQWERLTKRCQREPKFPQLWESKIPHPVHAPASSVRTRPAFNFSFSRYELPRMFSVTA